VVDICLTEYEKDIFLFIRWHKFRVRAKLGRESWSAAPAGLSLWKRAWTIVDLVPSS
jgi:hypothetical protein